MTETSRRTRSVPLTLDEFRSETVSAENAFARTTRKTVSKAAVVDPLLIPVLHVRDRAQLTRCPSVEKAETLARYLRQRGTHHNVAVKAEVNGKDVIWMARDKRKNT